MPLSELERKTKSVWRGEIERARRENHCLRSVREKIFLYVVENTNLILVTSVQAIPEISHLLFLLQKEHPFVFQYFYIIFPFFSFACKDLLGSIQTELSLYQVLFQVSRMFGERENIALSILLISQYAHSFIIAEQVLHDERIEHRAWEVGKGTFGRKLLE